MSTFPALTFSRDGLLGPEAVERQSTTALQAAPSLNYTRPPTRLSPLPPVWKWEALNLQFELSLIKLFPTDDTSLSVY